jgi:uncharacterized repeat protein (TIGR01451 family)
MFPRSQSRSIFSTTTFVILALLLIQLGAPIGSLAGASAESLTTPRSVRTLNAKGANGLPGNYDIRLNGGARLSTLVDRYAPGGTQSLTNKAQAKATTMRAGLGLLRAAVPGADARFSPLTGAAEVVRSRQGALTTPAPGRLGAAIVLDFLRSQQAVYGLSDAQIGALRVQGESVSRANGLRMVRLDQEVDGLPVFQSDSRFILDRDGRLVRSVGLLMPAGATVPQIRPISAQVALQAALATVDLAISADSLTLASTDELGNSAELVANDSRISGSVLSKLVYFPAAPGLLVPAWSQVTFTSGDADWYTLVDAGSGELLWRKNIRSSYPVIGSNQSKTMPPTIESAPAVAPAAQPGGPPTPQRIGPAVSTQQARFSVYVQADGVTPADNPAPNSPTNVAPGAGTQFPEIARTTVNMLTAQDIIASPNGWIPDGATTTTGNNVDAYVDRVGGTGEANVPDIGTIDNNGRPVGNPDGNSNNRDFLGAAPRDYTYLPAPQAGNPEAGTTPTGTGVDQVNFRRGVVTQLFYITNWYHDQLYNLGFDEAAGNFQTTNFSGMGNGGDPVLAEAQDNTGTNNANFATPPDGQSGRMQMYRFTGPTIDRDGSLDAEIVIHELTHGLSNRLIGNAAGLVWDVGGGMGEGWADFYALSLLNNTNADDPDGRYASGGYATYKLLAGYLDNYVYGIRRFPYSTDNGVNPLTWADVDDTTDSYAGGITISPIGFEDSGALEVHNTGEVWALTLWEIRSRIIADPAGANGDVPTGNRTMLQLTTDAMKLTPASPSVIDARDALIDADCATNACANERWIWEGFADRGLGYAANAPVTHMYGYTAGHMGVDESFVLPYLDTQTVVVDDSLGNNNGAIDPGEPIALAVTLTNPWRNTAQGVATATATLSTSTPGVTILDNTATYGVVAAQGSATGDQFLFALNPSAACGQSLTFTLQTNSALGSSSTSISLRVGQASGTGAPVTYTRSALGLAIPDNSPTGVMDTLTINDDYEIADLDFRVDNIQHTFTGDISVMLRAPTGYGTDLVSLIGGLVAGGGSGDNIINMLIDDDLPSTAANDMVQAAPAAAPHTKSWLPVFNAPWPPIAFGVPTDGVGALSRLDGVSAQGDWRVLVSDQEALDIGTLNAWSLIVTPRAFTCAAFTPSVAVAGVKSVTGSFVEGGTITYSVMLTNTGALAQADNPGNEFTDVLPAQLTLVSATATAGTAVANVGANTVTWNGALAPFGGSVTITIQATINAGASGATVNNQGSIAFDADGNGANEASAVTDNPATSTPNDPTSFVVSAPAITATNVDTLAVDQNANGQVNPGDTLKYMIVVTNSGSASASGVTFSSGVLDLNTQLVVGSVTTSQGGITSGNTTGNTTVGVTIGAIPAGGSVTLTFRVRIANPLPNGVTQVANQSTIAGSNFSPVFTNDPTTGASNDSTITPIVRFNLLYLPIVKGSSTTSLLRAAVPTTPAGRRMS